MIFVDSMGRYALPIRKTKRYTKIVPWEQPIATSNHHPVDGGYIDFSATVVSPHPAIDIFYLLSGSTSFEIDTHYWQYNGETTLPMEATIKFPYELYITSVSIVSRPNDNYNGTVEIYDGGGRKFGQATINSPTSRFSLYCGNAVITNSLTLKVPTHDPWFGLQNMYINAYRRIDIPAGEEINVFYEVK